jgi:hypothetical protein
VAGPYPYPEQYSQQGFPPPGDAAQPYPQQMPPAYPGMLPPPVDYPKRRRWPLLAGLGAALLLVVVIIATVVFAGRGDSAGGPLSDQRAQAAIQSYLDALSNGDDETIARNTLCGLYDGVKDRKSDMALAGLASDAFRKQFSAAEVTSIDKIVTWSPNQAQVLFTMRTTPTGGRSQQSTADEQGIAQLLTQGKDVLVCSYLLRTAGQY